MKAMTEGEIYQEMAELLARSNPDIEKYGIGPNLECIMRGIAKSEAYMQSKLSEEIRKLKESMGITE